MNPELALKVLGLIMGWEDDRARKEFQWLRLMARLKYDGYRDFQAGRRFVESLATWLQQFGKEDRETAYQFVRHTLVYFGPSEIQRLVEQFYPGFVLDRLIRTVAREKRIPAHKVMAATESREAVERLRRQTLFMGLSDGARTDAIRHANAGMISNEQMVQGVQVDMDKWKDLRNTLRKDLGDPEACFRLVYLIDDFTATGDSFFRFDADEGKWKGKLVRFKESVLQVIELLDGGPPLAQDWELCVHHYAGSTAAVEGMDANLKRAKSWFPKNGWAKETHLTFGMTLPRDFPIDKCGGRHDDFIKLARNHYDPTIQTRHTSVGGVENIALGYGGCALPLVLEHNTPNNSVALLWAESERDPKSEVSAPVMRPLFRRRQRHA